MRFFLNSVNFWTDSWENRPKVFGEIVGIVGARHTVLVVLLIPTVLGFSKLALPGSRQHCFWYVHLICVLVGVTFRTFQFRMLSQSCFLTDWMKWVLLPQLGFCRFWSCITHIVFFLFLLVRELLRADPFAEGFPMSSLQFSEEHGGVRPFRAWR